VSDVIHVVQEGGDPFWLTLLGNGGIGVLLGAGVGALVARMGRGREDRSAWREIRHERYTAIVQRLDDAYWRLSRVVNAPETWTNGVSEEDRQQLLEDAEMIRQDRISIRLQGYGEVYDTFFRIGLMFKLTNDELINGSSSYGSKPAAATRLSSLGYDIARLEKAMRKQLGLAEKNEVDYLLSRDRREQIILRLVSAVRHPIRGLRRILRPRVNRMPPPPPLPPEHRAFVSSCQLLVTRAH
jgi:hypothetical protein